ncbi:MAG: CheR family methyltransferase [Pyrinomonadaceae bacterium]
MSDIPEQHFELRDLVEQRTGLFFQDYLGVELLVNRLWPRRQECGCRSIAEYISLLRGENAGADEWREVITLLSKPVTSFLRHAELMRYLIDTAVPSLVSELKLNSLKIWSAGCATGEEPPFDRLSAVRSGMV